MADSRDDETRMIALLTAAFTAIGNIFGWSKQRSEEKNREDVVKGAESVQEQVLEDKAVKAVATGDVDEIRKELAE